jgi:myo-inositol-1(or 4)-monophosphatase
LPGSDAPPDAELAAPLAAAVRDAGRLALSSYQKPIKTWLKEHDSPVSEIDIAVDTLLKARLGAIAPDAAWLSEETEDDPVRLTARRVWIVDPIDGTRSYIAGRPDWTVSVALVENGRPILAALYAPVSEEFFLAAVGAGATRNGAPMRVAAGGGIEGARITGPRGLIDRLAAVGPAFVAVPRVHSLALRLARVADGTVDVAFAGHNSHDWDLAAADLLVHEAGGALTTIAGTELAYNGAVPTHGVLVAAGHSRLKALSALLRERDVQFH